MFMFGAPMLSIGTFIQHELERSGVSADAFRIELDDTSPGGDGLVRVSFAHDGELLVRYWSGPDARIILSVAMKPGSHSVRSLSRSEIAGGLAAIVQRWLCELRATSL
jgi:hypothetical protein